MQTTSSMGKKPKLRTPTQSNIHRTEEAPARGASHASGMIMNMIQAGQAAPHTLVEAALIACSMTKALSRQAQPGTGAPHQGPSSGRAMAFRDGGPAWEVLHAHLAQHVDNPWNRVPFHGPSAMLAMAWQQFPMPRLGLEMIGEGQVSQLVLIVTPMGTYLVFGHRRQGLGY